MLIDLKLLILDVDGVMTDGTKTYNNEGEVVSKKFCDLDFTAIKRFNLAGVRTCFLSADKRINQAIAKKRNIDFHFARLEDGTINKAPFVEEFEKEYSLPRNKMAYVGDDYYDLGIISKLEYTFCPSNSPRDVKEAVFKTLPVRSGEGVVASLFDNLTVYD